MLRALNISAGELADQRNIHPANEADLAGLRCERAHHADHIRSLMLAEHDGLHVRLVDDGIEDRELRLRKISGDFFERARLREADGQNGRESLAREAPQRLLALRVVLDFKIAEGDSGVRPELFRAPKGAFVEALVELSAEIVDDRGLEIGAHDGRHDNQRAAAEIFQSRLHQNNAPASKVLGPVRPAQKIARSTGFVQEQFASRMRPRHNPFRAPTGR